MGLALDAVEKAWMKPTDRDKQRKVGASDLSNPCNLCLWEKLHDVPRKEFNVYPMGAKIGTAIHAELERLMKAARPTAMCETRVTLGTYEGYGEVTSTADLYLPEECLLVDYKTTTKAKLKKLKILIEHDAVKEEPKLRAYIAQTQLYARGLKRTTGVVPENISIVFIPRDSSRFSDLFEWTFPVDLRYADSVWLRGQKLLDLDDPSVLKPLDGCFYCTNNRKYEVKRGVKQ